MKVIYIKNFRFKVLIFSGLMALWILMSIFADVIFSKSLIFKVTINNFIAFKYPYSFKVDNIYCSDQMSKAIQTNYNFILPVTKEFSNYNSISGKFGFQYPSVFTMDEQYFMGSDILYHIDFYNKSIDSHGFVQVWNMPYSLKDFLEGSKNTSLQNFKSFQSKDLKIKGLSGYMWDYVSPDKSENNIKAIEVFLKNNDKMYRISYFVPEKKWNQEQSDNFWSIVNSLELY